MTDDSPTDGGPANGGSADDGAADPATDPLIAVAREAYGNAYVPYSEYPVGAALRAADGTVFSGCNIENANYSNSLHAEEVALASAVRQGYTEFDRLAVASGARDGVTPCGMCRQTLAEFCDEDLEVVCDEGDGASTYTLGELIPETISFETLADAERRGGAAADGEAAEEAYDGASDDAGAKNGEDGAAADGDGRAGDGRAGDDRAGDR